jgi:hypothetical protein
VRDALARRLLVEQSRREELLVRVRALRGHQDDVPGLERDEEVPVREPEVARDGAVLVPEFQLGRDGGLRVRVADGAEAVHVEALPRDVHGEDVPSGGVRVRVRACDGFRREEELARLALDAELELGVARGGADGDGFVVARQDEPAVRAPRAARHALRVLAHDVHRLPDPGVVQEQVALRGGDGEDLARRVPREVSEILVPGPASAAPVEANGLALADAVDEHGVPDELLRARLEQHRELLAPRVPRELHHRGRVEVLAPVQRDLVVRRARAIQHEDAKLDAAHSEVLPVGRPRERRRPGAHLVRRHLEERPHDAEREPTRQDPRPSLCARERSTGRRKEQRATAGITA